ncbi:MAG: phosphopantetheine-binding protein [Hydrogenophaga sp.]|nr:phosphopantetheine-binding protein [Hydrogenophaga sp.]
MDTTQERLSALLTRDHQVQADQLTLDAPLESLGVDSLGTVELLWSVEETFKIQLPHDPPALVTFGDVVRYVDDLIAQQQAGHPPAPAAAP